VVAQTQYQQLLAQGLAMLPWTTARQRSASWSIRCASARPTSSKRPDPSEKATIEVVALMFQSILTEDRMPPSMRVWFARLQVPVLRVALAEPEFFSDLATRRAS
jgi:hypothetical protein